MQCLIPAILIPIIMVIITYAGLSSDGMGFEQINQMVGQMPINTFMVACTYSRSYTIFYYVHIHCNYCNIKRWRKMQYL